MATVVIVSWNGAHLLGPCLDSLKAQTLGADKFRTVVVDNASTDETSGLLAGYPWVRVVRTMQNLGFAGGATIGLRDADTPYAVVLNNDACPDKDWLKALLSGFSSDVAAVTSKVVLQPRYVEVPVACAIEGINDIVSIVAGGRDVTETVIAQVGGESTALLIPAADGQDMSVTVRTRRQQFDHLISKDAPRVDVINSVGGVLTSSGHGADRGYLQVDDGQYDHDEDVFAFCGAAAAFRTDVAGPMGWFDPWFFAYYEDLDLSWRMRRAGWRIRYVAGAKVRHHHAATSRVGSDLFLFYNRRNRLVTLARNARAQELAGFLRWSFARTVQSPQPIAIALGHRRPAVGANHRSTRRREAFTSAARHLPAVVRSRRTYARTVRSLRPGGSA